MKQKKFSSVEEASERLGNGTYTGTAPVSKKTDNFKSVEEASERLGNGTYTGTAPVSKNK